MSMVRKSGMIGVAALAFTVLWFALLAGRPLFDPDEGRYAEIPREMLLGGDWVIPHLNGLVYLEKPPLQYWLTALSFRTAGMSEFTARLATGVAGYLTLIGIFLIGRAMWGVEAGLNALFYTAASTLFVLIGHQLTLDMLLSFCLLAALGCFLMAQQSRNAPTRSGAWMLGCWAAMSLALLTKGLIGVLIPAATLTLYVIWQRDWRVLRRLNLRWGLPLFVALAAPWFVLAARANPAFLRFFFIREHFQRFLTPIEHRTEPWWFFIPVLLVGIMPWSVQALKALAAVLREAAPRGQFDAARLLCTWSVFTLLFFSLSDSKLVTYILPAVPALALLCAAPRFRGDHASLRLGAILSLASSLGILAYASGRWASLDAQALVSLIRPVLLCTGGLLALGAVLCMLLVRRNQLRAALAASSMAWFLATCTILVAANDAQALFSAKDIALTLRRAAASGEPVFSVESYEQSLAFYLRSAVILVNYRDEFDLGLLQEPHRGIATLSEFATIWAAQPQAFAVVSPQTRDRLAARRVPMREIAHFPGRMIISRR